MYIIYTNNTLCFIDQNNMTKIIKLLFVLTTVISAYQSVAESCYAHKFDKTEGMELPNHVITTVERSFVQLCWDECASLLECLSVNARRVWDVLYECDLNNSNTSFTALVAKQGNDYYEMTVSDIGI